MEEIANAIEDTQYESAVLSEIKPTRPWATPTEEQAAEFKAKKLQENANFMAKDEVLKNDLGQYLVKECGDEDWLTSPQCIEYMTMQWNREKKMSISDFNEFRTLGKGGFGLVSGVSRRTTGAIYANKIQNKLRVKEGKAMGLALAERRALCAIDSPFCVTVHYAFHDQGDLFLIMELLSGGDLRYHLRKQGKFSEEAARYFLACTIEGIGAIHDIGYVYRDLKPDNILMASDGRIKISDLGLATEVAGKDGKGIKGSAGTRGFWSPEMITKDKNGKSQIYGLSVDFWSLGCVAYALLEGCNPFYHKRINELYGDDNTIAIDEATKKMEVEYDDAIFSPVAKSFCQALLTRDPTQRLGNASWLDVAKHEFFAPCDFEALRKGELPPPYVPTEALNADDQGSIGEFAKAKGVTWDDADEGKCKDWDFTHEKRFYAEVIESLEWAKKDGNCDLRLKPPSKSSSCVVL